MEIHLRLGGDDWGIIFTWDSFQPSTPAAQQSIDISCPPGAQQQTRSSGVWRANDGTDK